MQLKHSHIFRQEALERLSSPEQLDQAINVVKPQAWLTLSTLSFVVAVAAFGVCSAEFPDCHRSRYLD